jgi:hypothetical protein
LEEFGALVEQGGPLKGKEAGEEDGEAVWETGGGEGQGSLLIATAVWLCRSSLETSLCFNSGSLNSSSCLN